MVFREVLARGLSSDLSIEVVATANDAYEARDKVIKYSPDVMTCDIEMPKMNGIEFIKRLLPQYPLRIIVVSSVSGAVFDAMNAGAVDFVQKPDVTVVKSVESFIHEMIVKVKIASVSKIPNTNRENFYNKFHSSFKVNNNIIIAIGASTGGTQAIHSILGNLPQNTPGIVITQHIPSGFSRMFAQRLNEATSLKVKEAESGDIVKRGQVLVAPGDRHMKIIKRAGEYYVECFKGERINGHCPSVDVLFESVAKAAGKNAIGIILTGMGYDGAKGLLEMRRKGARTIGQDEETSVVYGMPKVAFNIGAVEKQSSLNNIPGILFSMINSMIGNEH